MTITEAFDRSDRIVMRYDEAGGAIRLEFYNNGNLELQQFTSEVEVRWDKRKPTQVTITTEGNVILG